jgi:hypothetical protein
MPSGITFDVILAVVMICLAVWEAGVAIRRRERKRFVLVALAIVAGAVLLWLHAPQLRPE